MFQPDSIASHQVDTELNGIRVARFTPELQFVYTISKWSVDRDWAVNLKNINDVVHILTSHEKDFDEQLLAGWFAESPHLYPITLALLNYLQQSNVVAEMPRLQNVLTMSGHSFGSTRLKIMAWLLHTFPFNVGERQYASYSRWCAFALWSFVSQPAGRSFGIPGTLTRQLYLSAVYGEFSPVRKARASIRKLINQFNLR